MPRKKVVAVPEGKKYVSMSDMVVMSGMSRAKLYAFKAMGDFPEPHKFGGGSGVYYDRTEAQAWIDKKWERQKASTPANALNRAAGRPAKQAVDKASTAESPKQPTKVKTSKRKVDTNAAGVEQTTSDAASSPSEHAESRDVEAIADTLEVVPPKIKPPQVGEIVEGSVTVDSDGVERGMIYTRVRTKGERLRRQTNVGGNSVTVEIMKRNYKIVPEPYVKRGKKSK